MSSELDRRVQHASALCQIRQGGSFVADVGSIAQLRDVHGLSYPSLYTKAQLEHFSRLLPTPGKLEFATD